MRQPLTEADFTAIDRLNDLAFEGTYESQLVRRLRADGLAAVELIAVETGRIVGHILLSRLDVSVDGRAIDTLSLAPMAVEPGFRGKGIGSRLVEQALAEAKAAGHAAVIVLGHPDYYPRFGFSSARAAHLASPFSGEAFMALELASGSLEGASGQVIYPPAFGDLTP